MDDNNLEKWCVEKNPELLKEWHTIKNGILTPQNVTPMSGKKVWWHGKCGHEWDASVKERVRGYGCPICAGKRVVAGVNDLKTLNPEVADQWNHEKNGSLNPEMFTSKSHKVVWWKCEKGHEWQSPIDNRTRGHRCPYCSSKYVFKGETDLESQNPVLAKEYLTEKNKKTACEVFANSHSKVWWKCSLCNHEWQASIDSRNRGNGCPACAKRTQTSFPEQAIFYYVKQLHSDAENKYTELFNNTMELDIFIPSIKIGIEYDGAHWHNEQSRTKEAEKYRICKEKQIRLIRIKEKEDSVENNADIVIVIKDTLNDAIRKLSEYIHMPDNIDCDRDRLKIIEGYVSYLKENSFAKKYPEKAKEWHPTKNGQLTPDMFSPFSMVTKVWWKCEKGHEWQATIAHRTGMNSNCPYCSSRKLLVGFNDFSTTNTNKELLAEWNYEKNEQENMTPASLTEGSKKKVWWRCSDCGYEWKTTISTRKRGCGCPACAGRDVAVGINDLASKSPKLASEWNYERNEPLLPTMLTFGSNKKVWWKCEKGHEWQSVVNSRFRNNTGCPYCSNRFVLEGFNDLSTTNPHLAMQWNYEKNNNLLPSMVTAGSGKKVWWKCEKGHEWQSAVKDRNRGAGCPFCKNKTK